MPVKTGTFVAVAIITAYKYVKLQNFKSIYQLIKKVHFLQPNGISSQIHSVYTTDQTLVM